MKYKLYKIYRNISEYENITKSSVSPKVKIRPGNPTTTWCRALTKTKGARNKRALTIKWNASLGTRCRTVAECQKVYLRNR